MLQAAEAAEVRSSKSCSKTANCSPFLETEGGRPPKEEENSKNVSMTVVFSTKAAVVAAAAIEDAAVAVSLDGGVEMAFPPLLEPFVFLLALEVVVDSAADESVVDESAADVDESAADVEDAATDAAADVAPGLSTAD